jgi:hypothetical protein
LQSSFDQSDVAWAVRARSDASLGGGDVLVMADADFLLDRFYREGRGEAFQDVADNALFLRQAIRVLAGGGGDAFSPAPAPQAAQAPLWGVAIAAAIGPLLIFLWSMFVLRGRRR